MQNLRNQASPDIAALLERFGEPLRDKDRSVLRAAKPPLQAPSLGHAIDAEPKPIPAGPKKTGQSKHLASALGCLVTASAAIALVLFWQDVTAFFAGSGPTEPASTASPSTAAAAQQPVSTALEVVLSSPERIDADAGEEIDFPIAIDATDALPARTIIAVTALPEGASFSEGRPYGATGWSLRPDEIGALRLHLPPRAGASDMRLELVSGDGAVLAQSETRVSIAPSPAQVASVAVVDSAVEREPAKSDSAITGSVGSVPPPPARKPSLPAGTGRGLKVTTVKVVPIPALSPAAKPVPVPAANPFRPHDGGFALGPASEDPQPAGEWMTTKTAVDMHAKAEQTSETVKVAEGGVKMRVLARDKNWVQVKDPNSSATGWIYNRFLTPAEPTAQ